MNSQIELLNKIMLVDSDGNESIIIGVRGAECGLDHLELSTQSEFEKEHGIKTVLKVYSSEHPA